MAKRYKYGIYCERDDDADEWVVTEYNGARLPAVELFRGDFAEAHNHYEAEKRSLNFFRSMKR